MKQLGDRLLRTTQRLLNYSNPGKSAVLQLDSRDPEVRRGPPIMCLLASVAECSRAWPISLIRWWTCWTA